MSIFSLAILVFVVSLLGTLVLIGAGFFSTKGLRAEQLCRELLFMGPFFDDFAGTVSFLKKISEKFHFSFFGRNRFGQAYFKKYYCLFLNFVYGKRTMEKNGCEGYWGKLNGSGKKKRNKSQGSSAG